MHGDSLMYLLTAPPHLPAEPLHLLQLHDRTEYRTNLNKQSSSGCPASNVPLCLLINETSLSPLFRFSCSAAANQCSIFNSPLVAFPSPLTHSFSGVWLSSFPLYFSAFCIAKTAFCLYPLLLLPICSLSLLFPSLMLSGLSSYSPSRVPHAISLFCGSILLLSFFVLHADLGNSPVFQLGASFKLPCIDLCLLCCCHPVSRSDGGKTGIQLSASPFPSFLLTLTVAQLW